MTKTAVLFILTAVAFSGAAFAKPPPNADPALHGWFQSLRQPKTGVSCCSVSDCHRLTENQWRMTPGGYQVEIGSRWVNVPQSHVLEHQRNPSGGAVACYDDVRRVVFCFVPGQET